VPESPSKPGRKPATTYSRDSHRRAIDCGLEYAFPPPGELAKREDETWAEYHAWLTKKQKADVTQIYAERDMDRAATVAATIG